MVENCNGNYSKPTKIPLINETLFKNDFYIRVFTSGCYYFEKSINKWTSHGMNVLSDTNATHTHCSSSHLTDFAAGFRSESLLIDFEFILSKACVEKNSIVLTTIVISFILFLLFVSWSIFKDRKDKLKITMNRMTDNDSDNNYFYEVIAFTGTMAQAGTESNVFEV